MTEVTYHPKADDEVLEAARFYEKRSQGLGWRFLRIVREAETGLPGALDRFLCSTTRFAGASCEDSLTVCCFASRTIEFSSSPLRTRDGVQGTGVSEYAAVPNKAMEPTGLSMPSRRERLCAGGSSPRR